MATDNTLTNLAMAVSCAVALIVAMAAAVTAQCRMARIDATQAAVVEAGQESIGASLSPAGS